MCSRAQSWLRNVRELRECELRRIPRMRTSTYRLSRKLDFRVTEFSEVRAKSLLVASYATGGKRSPASELKWEEGEESKHALDTRKAPSRGLLQVEGSLRLYARVQALPRREGLPNPRHRRRQQPFAGDGRVRDRRSDTRGPGSGLREGGHGPRRGQRRTRYPGGRAARRRQRVERSGGHKDWGRGTR